MTSSNNGLCEGVVPIPAQWFSHTATTAEFAVHIRLLSSFDPPQVIGRVAVNPRPNMAFVDDVAFVVPSRPVSRLQVFSIPVYAHATYSTAAYSVVCQLSENLAIKGVTVDDSAWMAELRPLNISGSLELGVVAILTDPESVTESVRTEPELLFSFEVRVLSSAQAGGVESINCTTAYLSNIFNEKIQPRGLVTPVSTLSIGAAMIEPGAGQVRIAESIPRGLFSFSERSQLANAAVLDNQPVSVALTHLVALSSGVLEVARNVECRSDSSAFQLSPQCNSITLDGTETSGTNRGTISTSSSNFTSSVQIRVWFPALPARVSVSSSTLRPIRGWLSLDDQGQCLQRYEESSLDVFADFSYGSSSPSFSISVLPYVIDAVNSSRPEVVTISSDGTLRGL